MQPHAMLLLKISLFRGDHLERMRKALQPAAAIDLRSRIQASRASSIRWTGRQCRYQVRGMRRPAQVPFPGSRRMRWLFFRMESSQCRKKRRRSKRPAVCVILEKCYIKDEQYHIDKRLTIGKLNDASTLAMHPNSNYASLYPQKFQAFDESEKTGTEAKKIDLYASSLAVSAETGLHQTSIEGFGTASTNFLIHYAMYSLQYETGKEPGFALSMRGRLYGKAWVSLSSPEAFREAPWMRFRMPGAQP